MDLRPLSRLPETDAGLDYEQLRAIGLEHVRRLGRRIWTDHNVHDPGITTLELLCYALTDLSYRARFPIEDLLATESGTVANMEQQFFTPRQILPNCALSEADYRKLVINLPGVKNAWILPVPLTFYADTLKHELRRDHPGTPGIREVKVRGRYKVLVEFMDDITSKAERDKVKDRVLSLLAGHRNLCEDFIAVDEVPTLDHALCAELELEPGADANEVVATVQFQVQRYLAPPVHNYSLSEMLARKHEDDSPYTAPEIFEGPALTHGFIDDAELATSALRSEVRLSDIISVIMDIPGVRAVRDIVVNALADGPEPPCNSIPPADKWRLPVPEGVQPRLSTDCSRVVCYKGHMPLPVDRDRVDGLRKVMEDEEKTKLDTLPAEDMAIPLGRVRRVSDYYSFQQHFPVIYGLPDQGLPARGDPLRQAQAMQLKGYLLFFDQVMANYFAQLTQVRELFSRETTTARTYFAQVVRSVPQWEKLYDDQADSDDKLAPLFESDADALLRRDRFVDHLLARFSEDFHRYAEIMRSRFGFSLSSTQAAKYAFLQDCPQLGAERALAYDYRRKQPRDLWNSLNVSGLERRLARLLAIPNWSRRNLGKISFDIYAELDATPDDEFRFRVLHPVSGKILLSSTTRYVSKEAARAAMIRAIEFAQQAGAYKPRKTDKGKHYFVIVDDKDDVIAMRKQYFPTEDAMNAAIDALIDHLAKHYSGEGMYLVENLLLLPEHTDDPLLPICVDPACIDCADDDPYSYRLHIVLPAYAGRFQDMDFRRFVEETIRLEMPAHILPKICWVDVDDMAAFEDAYRDWISLRAGATHAQRKTKLETFIQALYSVKNIYPEQKLHECLADESRPSFILGRSALGSQDHQ
jgi:hypothetical protein